MRRAIIIAGMHRSGTSAFARTINLLGADLPANLVPSVKDENELGFWEPLKIVRLHDEALASAASSWDDVSPLAPAWFQSDVAAAIEDRLIDLVESEFGESAFFVVKDPRICRLLPLWKRAIGRMGVSPSVVLPLRNPLEVAGSLRKRHGLSTGHCILLWLRYVLDAEKESRDLPRSFVAYEALLRDWRGTTKKIADDLGLEWPRISHRAVLEIERFLSEEQRHHEFSREELETRDDVVTWVKDAFGLASDAAHGGDRVAAHAFDRLASELSAADLSYGSVLAEIKAEVADLERDLAAEREERASLEKRITAEQEERASLEKRITAEQEERASLEKRIASAHGRMADAENDLCAARASLSRNEAQVTEMRGELDRLRSLELAWLQERAARSRRPWVTWIKVSRARGRTLTHLLSWLVKNPSSERFGQIRTYLKLRHSGLFDADYYVGRYADVAQAGINPLLHYIEFGAREGRDPSPAFNTLRYLNQHPDARRSGLNPLVHYLSGRAPSGQPTEEGKPSHARPTRSSLVSLAQLRPEHANRRPARQGLLEAPAEAAFESDERVSVIVLNRDGEPILDDLFRGLAKWSSHHELEIVFIDHASSDGSLARARSWEAKLPLSTIETGGNNTFSSSNNRAAEIAAGTHLLFLNNDIVVEEDNLRQMLRLIRDPDVGAVGMRLHDSTRSRSESLGPVQHLGIRFGPWESALGFRRPYNIRPFDDQDEILADAPISVPAVTGAALLCRREDFLALGGFSEDYVFGYEDVDLCLKMRTRLGKKVASANQTGAVHLEGWSRARVDSDLTRRRRLNNVDVLWRRFGYAIRRGETLGLLTDDGSRTGGRFSIGFAVTDAARGTAAGDYYTALELGESIARTLGWDVCFLPRDSWYAPCELDAIVAMVDDFDPLKVQNENPEAISVAWMRNWFDRWLDRPSFGDFDVYLASSSKAAEFVRRTGGVESHVFRLATNPEVFNVAQGQTAPRYDYVFTGSRWGVARELEEILDPERLPLRGALFGKGWDEEPRLRAIWKGFKPYDELPDAYRAAKIVVDDANHVTKPWGSVNSRVFDGLACGALVISNGELGSAEVFGSSLPVYRDREELEQLLTQYAGDDVARARLSDELRALVLEHHTYDRRADELLGVLRDFRTRKYRIAIKTPVPSHEVAHEWGDHHFARALKRSLKKQGHSVRIDILPEWEREESVADDVVIVLRGLSRYRPRTGQINLLWNISHPDKVSDEEFESYDHVFVASLSYAGELGGRLSVPITSLLQCTDPETFKPPVNGSDHRYEILFVGNTRKQFRRSVKDAVEADLPITVVGAGWDAFIDASYIAGGHIPHDELHEAYAAASIVLNDHWPSMAEKGFISNRLFDVAASGGFVLTDRVAGIEEVFGDTIPTYDSAEELREAVAFFREHPEDRQEKAARIRGIVHSAHTFDHRTDVILGVVDDLHALQMEGSVDEPLPDRAGLELALDRLVRAPEGEPPAISVVEETSTVASLKPAPRFSTSAERKPPWYPDGIKRLNLGCGPRDLRAEWWNVDIRPFPGVDQVLDATKRWPYPDASLEYVFGEHFLEHLDVEGAVTLLTEARRCLLTTGSLRLSTPSLEWVVASHFDLGESSTDESVAGAFRLNRAFHGWGHQFLYSRPMLVYMLDECGFVDIEFHDYGQSNDVNLRGVERHGEPSQHGGFASVWIVEARPGEEDPMSLTRLRERISEDYARYVRTGH